MHVEILEAFQEFPKLTAPQPTHAGIGHHELVQANFTKETNK